jgi:cytochrome c551/c552
MKISGRVSLFALSVLIGTSASVEISDGDAVKLMAKYNCQACHALDKKLIGPAF